MNAMQSIFVGIVVIGLQTLIAPAFGASGDGGELAEGLSNLARFDQEVDMEPLARELRQPELLNDGMKWFGPFGKMSTPMFRGAYDPTSSELGIKKIAVDWRLHRLGDKVGWLTTLEVMIMPESCPTAEELSKATGVKMFDSVAGNRDGPGMHATHSITIKQQSGEPVYINYFPGTYCRITISRVREAY